jgi:hypothetical protein
MAKKSVNAKGGTQKIIKIAVNVVLAAFILFSIGYALVKAGFGKAETKTLEGPAAVIATPAVEKGKVVLYYLHSTGRCSNCILMEKYSKEAVDMYFQKQLKNGELEFHVFNVDDPENRHYVQDYQLMTKSLVVTLVKGGKELKYENLKGIWDYLRDQNAFHGYVKANVEKYLQEIK